MPINEQIYGSKEVWTKPYGEATSDKNSFKVANWNTAESVYARIRTQMYTYNNPGVIFNNWDNRQDDTFMDMSIIPFGIGEGSGLSNIDWFVKFGSTVNDITLGNQDKRQITNIAYVTEDDLMASTWCLDGAGQLTGGVQTAYTYYQHISKNRWSSLYGTAFSTESHAAGGSGSGHYDSVWNPCRIATYLPTKNIVLTPSITAINSSGSVATYTKISDLVTNKSTRKLLALRINFSYKPTGTRTNLPIKPFFFDDTNIQKGFINYPKEGGIDVEVNQTIKLPIIQNASTIFTLIGTAAYNSYIEFPSDTTHHYTFPVFQSSKLSFAGEVINNRFYYTCDISQMSDDELREAIMEQIAFMGMLFVDDAANVTLPIYDDNMYLGEIKDGITTGNYTHGSENLTQPQLQWDDYFQSEYDPYNPHIPMPDNWDDNANKPYLITNRSLLNKWYIIDELIMNVVFNKMTDIDLDTMDKNLTYGLNPIDCIIQARRIFFNKNFALNQFFNPTQVTDISFGKLLMNVLETPSQSLIKIDYNRPVKFESVVSYPIGEPSQYRDFRSYMPYTSCAFSDAFCGIIEIDPAKILNRYITIIQTVDLVTGDKITSLYSSTNNSNIGERVATLNGNCSEDLPINGLQAADYIRNKYLLNKQQTNAVWYAISRGAMGAAGATISGVAGNYYGAIPQAIGTIANVALALNQASIANYQKTHLTPQASKVSQGTPNVEAGAIFGPTLFLYLPIMNENYDELLYGNLTGFSGYKIVKPKDLNAGTHIFSHPKVSISGTKSEAYMLTDQLQKGIIIK